MPQQRRPAKAFDFEAELDRILGPDPNDPNKGAKAVRAEDFLPEGPGFAGRAINEMLPDFLTAGKTLLRTPVDMVRGAVELQKDPIISGLPGGVPAFLLAQGLVGGAQDALTLLKSLGVGASALAGGNPAIPQGVPEAGGRALGAIAMGRLGGRMAGRVPGMSTLQSLLKEKLAAPTPKPAPKLGGMAEADAIRMLLGPEGPAPRPSGPMVEVPADLGFRTQMGPGETVLRALLPERFQRPHQMPADVGVFDTRFTGNQPPSPGFRGIPQSDLIDTSMMIRKDPKTGARLLEPSDPVPPADGFRRAYDSRPSNIADAEFRMFENMRRQIETLKARATLAELVDGDKQTAQQLRLQADALERLSYERRNVRSNSAFRNIVPRVKPNLPE